MRGGERGQALTTFVAVSMLALLAVCGLVVDGGARARAARLASLAAAGAARAAADDTAAHRIAGVPVEARAATAAAERALAAYPGMAVEVVLAGTVVEVRTSSTVPTVFLGLVGIDSFTVTGIATAELQVGGR
jgi:hypothetical protein